MNGDIGALDTAFDQKRTWPRRPSLEDIYNRIEGSLNPSTLDCFHARGRIYPWIWINGTYVAQSCCNRCRCVFEQMGYDLVPYSY